MIHTSFLSMPFSVGSVLGLVLVALISLSGVRFLFYFHWPRYRRLRVYTTADLRRLPRVPFVKIQITTRGSEGSTPVIRRGIQRVLVLAQEVPTFYGSFLFLRRIC